MSEAIAPIVNALNAPFWAAAAEDALVLPYCAQTGRAFWPPSPISPFVTGGSVDWRPAAAEGVVLTVAVYRRAFQKAFEPLMPYGVALVAMAAGPRLMVHVPAPDAAEAPSAGDRVAIHFRAVLPDGPPIPIAIKAGMQP